MLPQELKPSDRLEAGWLNRLVREAVARALSVGPGLRLTRTPAGTNLSLAGGCGRGGASGHAPCGRLLRAGSGGAAPAPVVWNPLAAEGTPLLAILTSDRSWGD